MTHGIFFVLLSDKQGFFVKTIDTPQDMHLTIHDVARFFNVSERTVYRWLDQKTIPAYRVSDQYRFNRAEILDWASARKISVYPDFFKSADDGSQPMPGFTETLKNGGINYRVECSDKGGALKQVIRMMRLPRELDPEFLWSVLMSREDMASTGMGDGIAIPHVRNPVVLNIDEPLVSLCFLEEPVDFQALDGKPVFCLFTLICPTAKMHLHLLSRLSFILRDPEAKNAVMTQKTRNEIISSFVMAERGLGAPAVARGAAEVSA
jgi:PTS system nitrogen regulatory IIA component